ncbi:hypothetical protein A3A60_00765 [Candidatus Curtissbacteria bacterium RIFCSPLOWO2_01_FULL_42_26]|uniref:RCK N-terminal domain-containing protein n=1 Tax=Candidatus Curtissbacteria bacterium RIFCSPLOWO2_01_FULL_42_26 TaxID=1797729 RepID=A0A1F5HXT6_9BACT|nr:MAG: hypothetical protein A3A60_00765 [Candidatus Curtissbacteria bacterium RIFCSPLOWO2_01_FULL_42_26]
MPHLFLQLATVLALATGLGIIARTLRQPLILAYIFAGIVISYLGILKVVESNFLELLSNFGIAFLLFLVGIELKIDDLKSVGKAAVFTGLGQIIFTALIGYVLILGLGFSVVSALYIATALTFSSTVIIIKLLSEKNELQSLYGKITVGFLLVQDFVAILALMVLSGFSSGQVPSAAGLILIIFKGALLSGFTWAAVRFGLLNLFRMASVSVELLFVAAIAWAFLLSAVAEQMGFSVAIGAFLAGVAVASSPYRTQISARVKPLRDFFLIIFFILLGSSLSFASGAIQLTNVVILSMFILIGNPLIVIAIMMSMGFRNRTSFLASITVAQISEFSLILMSVGKGLGHVSASDVSLVAAVGIVTITLSSYLILYGDKIYRMLQKPMAQLFAEKANDPYVTNKEILKGHAILVGAEQMGWDILQFLKGKFTDRSQILVVDFNPDVYKSVRAAGFNAVFGDITDPELLEELTIERSKLIVITDPDFEDAIHLIKFAKDKNFKGPIIATVYWSHDAVRLYEAGCDYVVVPEEVGGKHLSRFLAENWEDLARIKKGKSKHFEELMGKRIF